MNKTEQLLKEFYNKKINPSVFARQFEDLTIDEKNRIEETFSFQWFVFVKNWNELKKDLNLVAFLSWYILILLTISVVYLMVIIFNSITI